MNEYGVDGLPFPPELHYLVEHQVWARFGGDGTALVGITALGIRLAGEIYMCRVKAPGSVVTRGGSIAVVELAKSIVSVKSPVGGAVLEANPRLAGEQELVHLDPYGEGWLARLAVSDAQADQAALLHGDAVVAAMARHAWLNRVE